MIWLLPFIFLYKQHGFYCLQFYASINTNWQKSLSDYFDFGWLEINRKFNYFLRFGCCRSFLLCVMDKKSFGLSVFKIRIVHIIRKYIMFIVINDNRYMHILHKILACNQVFKNQNKTLFFVLWLLKIIINNNEFVENGINIEYISG